MKRIKPGEMYLYNNQRKRDGLPLHRKRDKRKRRFTRLECIESINAFLSYCDENENINKYY